MNIGRFFWRTPFRKTVDAIAKKIRESDFGKKEPLIEFTGEEADLYMAARNACSNFAHANRAVIAHNVSETIKEVLGRDPEMELLYDMPHILVSREEHFGKSLWVHRNGTSRAYGPSRMSDHPVFKETGEPAFIPTSMSTKITSMKLNGKAIASRSLTEIEVKDGSVITIEVVAPDWVTTSTYTFTVVKV